MSQSFFGGPLRSFRKSYRDFAETKWAKEGHLLVRVLHPFFRLRGKRWTCPSLSIDTCNINWFMQWQPSSG